MKMTSSCSIFPPSFPPAAFAYASRGLATDRFTLQTSPSAGSVRARPHLGVRIANSKGVPGTLGCVARNIINRGIVLLSNWHILFGNGGHDDGEIWMVDETDGARRYSAVGRALYGKIGKVRLGGEDYYVDCAVSSWLYPPKIPSSSPWGGTNTNWPIFTGHDAARPGDLVTKTGAATGITAGIVVEINHCDFALIGGRSQPASRQLLVRSVNSDVVFCAEGDSGSVIVNALGKAVGLLWGTTSRGEGVACPISPVLNSLNITLDLSPRKALQGRDAASTGSANIGRMDTSLADPI